MPLDSEGDTSLFPRQLHQSEKAKLAQQHVSQAEAAERLNVSTRSVKHAAKVQDQGAPELVDAVTRGDVAVSTAAEIATLPQDEQIELVARGEDQILAAAKTYEAGDVQFVRLLL